MATNFLMDFINKHTFIAAFIIIGLFLLIKYVLMPLLNVKEIKKELDKTRKEMAKTLNESLTNATNILPGNEKRRKWNKRT